MPDIDRFDPELDRRTEALFRRFEAETDDVLEPLPPSAIRQLGDRRRTRRRTGIAAGTLALAAVAAGSALGLGGILPSQRARVDTASNPSPSQVTTAPAGPTGSPLPVFTPSSPPKSQQPVPEPAPSSEAASASPSPSDSITASPEPSGTPEATPSRSTAAASPAGWGQVADASSIYLTSPGDLAEESRLENDAKPQRSVSLCDRGRQGLGQSSDLNRHLGDGQAQAHVMVYSFTSVEQASQARSALRSWYHDCPATATAFGNQQVTLGEPVDLPLGERARQASGTTQSTFRQVTYTAATRTAMVEQASIIQVGNRLEWITFVAPAEGAPSPMDSPVRRRAAAISDQLAG
ncbi:hypothetical protein [Luteococcus peritonei]|uniref:PknH-like extracellular domain-containing protein n=1 Tax=Luteococcus peritonei TaxID=88874 RepID=A0ABW4RXK6_9ACTN